MRYLLKKTILFLFVFASCSNTRLVKNKVHQNQIEAIKAVDIQFNLTNKEGQSILPDSPMHIGKVFYKDFILIKEYYQEYQGLPESFSGDTATVKMANPVEKYFYYIYDTAKTFFYKVNSLDSQPDLKPIKLDLDAYIGKKPMLNFEKMYMVLKGNLVLLDSVQKSNGDFVYINKAKVKPQASFSDSTFFYYRRDSAFMSIPFSFAKSLDNSGRGKLFKIIIKYKENPLGGTAYEKMAKQLSFEMKTVKEDNEAALRIFLDSFKEKYISPKK